MSNDTVSALSMRGFKGFKKCTIKLRVWNYEKTGVNDAGQDMYKPVYSDVETVAMVKGDWGIHLQERSAGGDVKYFFCVTHVPTGLLLCRYDFINIDLYLEIRSTAQSKKRAKALVEALAPISFTTLGIGLDSPAPPPDTALGKTYKQERELITDIIRAVRWDVSLEEYRKTIKA